MTRAEPAQEKTASPMAERIHITTAIFYCNGTPHVGSAYEALAADVFARYQRRKLGRENVSFLSGTDEHGDKIRRAALAEGLKPQAYTDKMSALFDEAFRGLGVSYDYWVRTTDEVHQKWVQEMLRRTHARGDIYFRDYEGLYCVDCERFYTEKELLPGNVCPTHNRPVELISEGNYFLRIEKYREQVLEHIRRNPDFIRPERYRKEALNMLSEPLTDLCISRPKARLDWGIELPFDSNYVTYVWYDAFWAYVSHPATNDPELRREGVAQHRAFHRQGHPEDPRGVLAADPARRGAAAVQASQRSRMAQFRRRADVQELGQRARPGLLRAAPSAPTCCATS